jgi:hypothetical protein
MLGVRRAYIVVLASTLWFAWGCRGSGQEAQDLGETDEPAEPSAGTAARAVGAAEGGEPVEAAPRERAEERACNERMAGLLREPPLPGTPVLDGQRTIVLARAKAHPSLFRRPPTVASTDPVAAALRRQILAASVPARELYDRYSMVIASPDRARAVLLREGYLYAEDPSFSLALATVVRLDHLFDSPEVFIHRGDRVLEAERRSVGRGHVYYHRGGPEDGMPAEVWLLDRVGASRGELESPLHVDLLPLARALGFDEMSVRHHTTDAMVADLSYGGSWVTTIIETSGATARLACEVPPAGSEQAIVEYRSEAERRERALGRQRAVILEQMSEALPFDEPKTEIGQQDGMLRQEWSWAYRFGRTRYEFNDDKYPVFDGLGRPRVPQVCIDFIRDTYERASGSWYGLRDEPRVRRPGRLDFRTLDIENARSVESFVRFAEEHPMWFDVLNLPEQERIAFGRRGEFFEYLRANRMKFRPGDVVTILGLRDDEKLHYHSFFIFMSDPVTGMPNLLAANAGRPRIRSWEGEMQNAPRRSIKSRIRPQTAWLESVTDAEDLTSSRDDPPAGGTAI